MTIERILIENYGFKNFTFPNGSYEFLNKEEGKLGFLKYILKYSKESKEIEDLDKFIRFTFVRNPYDRACSGIRYLSENSVEDFSTNFFDFYERCIKNPFYYIHFFLSQSDCLKDLDDKIEIDYIGRFENFNQDLQYIIFEVFKFERKDLSKYHIHKTDPSLISFDKGIVNEIVENYLNDDFINFDYSTNKI